MDFGLIGVLSTSQELVRQVLRHQIPSSQVHSTPVRPSGTLRGIFRTSGILGLTTWIFLCKRISGSPQESKPESLSQQISSIWRTIHSLASRFRIPRAPISEKSFQLACRTGQFSSGCTCISRPNDAVTLTLALPPFSRGDISLWADLKSKGENHDVFSIRNPARKAKRS